MLSISSFFEIYKLTFVYGFSILLSMLVLFFLTNTLYQWQLKKEKRYLTPSTAFPAKLVKKILNVLWLVLGIVALSFLFVEEGKYAALQNHFKIVLYLGFLALLTIVFALITNWWFNKSIENKIQNNEDPTAFKFLRYVAVIVISFLGVLFGLLVFPSLRGVAQTALGGAGVIALIVGVASQEALSNIIGGIFIISFKPFKIGDVIKISDEMVGKVRDITLRHTVIRDFENKMIVIPNAIINKEKLINYDLDELKICDRIEIGITYDSNVETAKRIMQEVCESHSLNYDNRTAVEIKEGKPIVRTAITRLNESSVTVRAWVWAKNYGDSFDLRCFALENIKKRFEEEGVGIPYPHRIVMIKEEKGTSDKTA